MKTIKYLPLFIFLVASVSWACMSKGSKNATKKQVGQFFSVKKRKPANNIARFATGSVRTSWEAKLGNLLLDHNSDEVVLSIPAVLQKSTFHPFGDGQSNAKLETSPDWAFDEFPAVGFQEKSNNKVIRRYEFHPSLKITSYDESSAGDQWYKVTPKGWKDSFYFNFSSATLHQDDFVNGIPQKLRTFSSNRVAPNLSKIPKGYQTSHLKNLGEGYNQDAWFADNVHGVFPDAGGGKTALGGVLTWGIVDLSFGPFKTLYTCFEARDPGKEKDLGIPTGSGWHHIGDPAETIFNNLENLPLPVATGRTHQYANAAYGLTETLTATWLRSDEVLVNEKGSFHWYLNPYDQMVCTEIWVHTCVPSISNNWGFNCP